MNLHGIVALAAVLLGGAHPAAVARAAEAQIVGTLLFRDRDRRVTPAEAERLLRGKPISLALRNGGEVVTARPDRDGRFVAKVGPGAWRLEWIDVGARAEVLASPLVFDVRAGAPTCAGRIEVAYADLESELGASAAGTVRVEAGCDGGPGRDVAGRAVEHAFAPELYEPPFGFPEVAEGVRVGGFFVEQEPGLRLSWAVPLRRPLGWMGGLVVVGGVSRHFAADGERDGLELGGGFTPYWGAELTGGLRADRGASGVAPWAGVRLGPAPYAFTVRADFRDGVAWSFGLEVSAFHFLGRFL